MGKSQELTGDAPTLRVALRWSSRSKQWEVTATGHAGSHHWVCSKRADSDAPLDEVMTRVVVDAIIRELESVLPF